MSLPLGKTLSELRLAVMIRAALATTLDAGLAWTPIIDEYLRSNQEKLFNEFSWCRLETTVSTAITLGQRDYDIPSEIQNAGQIHRVSVIDNTGRIWALNHNEDGGLENAIARDTNNVQVNGKMAWYRIIDGVLRVGPPPDATQVTLVIEMMPGASRLVADLDRCSVDSEALIQAATADLIDRVGVQDSRMIRAGLARHLGNLQSRQRPPMAFSFASQNLVGPGYKCGTPSVGGNVPYTTNWNPF